MQHRIGFRKTPVIGRCPVLSFVDRRRRRLPGGKRASAKVDRKRTKIGKNKWFEKVSKHDPPYLLCPNPVGEPIDDLTAFSDWIDMSAEHMFAEWRGNDRHNSLRTHRARLTRLGPEVKSQLGWDGQ